jgi:L-cystine uptake protein TcyP (sodium:dicarboxylate symporter family)
MFWKKDNFLMGLIMGLVAPVLGILLFKMYNFKSLSVKETIQWMFYIEPGFKTLTVALSLSLLLNALLFTIYINTHKDKTAKGIFATTLVYGLIVLSIKTFL